MMTDKVFVVTAGSYSDYGILRVFGNRAAAEEFCKSYNADKSDYGSTNEIEEYELLESDPGMYDKFHASCYIEGPAEGDGEVTIKVTDPSARPEIGPTTTRPTVTYGTIYGTEEDYRPYRYVDNDMWRERGKVGLTQVSLHCTGPSADVVLHALREKAMQVKAEWMVWQARANEGREK